MYKLSVLSIHLRLIISNPQGARSRTIEAHYFEPSRDTLENNRRSLFRTLKGHARYNKRMLVYRVIRGSRKNFFLLLLEDGEDENEEEEEEFNWNWKQELYQVILLLLFFCYLIAPLFQFRIRID